MLPAVISPCCTSVLLPAGAFLQNIGASTIDKSSDIVYNGIDLGVGMEPFWRGLVERSMFPRRTPPAPSFCILVKGLAVPTSHGTMQCSFLRREEKTVELTPEQEETVGKIMVEMDCPKDFTCHEGTFENICRAHVYAGADLIRCLSSGGPDCPMSYAFSDDVLFCKCRLRRYVAMGLGR
jgi:hypothetical protein